MGASTGWAGFSNATGRGREVGMQSCAVTAAKGHPRQAARSRTATRVHADGGCPRPERRGLGRRIAMVWDGNCCPDKSKRCAAGDGTAEQLATRHLGSVPHRGARNEGGPPINLPSTPARRGKIRRNRAMFRVRCRPPARDRVLLATECCVRATIIAILWRLCRLAVPPNPSTNVAPVAAQIPCEAADPRVDPSCPHQPAAPVARMGGRHGRELPFHWRQEPTDAT